MKKILVCLLLIVFCAPAFAQKPDYRRPAHLGISFILNDFTTAQRIRTTSLTSVLNNKQTAKIREMSSGLGITYFKGLTKFIDFAGTVSGSFASIKNDNNSTSGGDNFLLETDASAQFKLFSDSYVVSPYLNAGVGFSHYDGKFDAILPLGVGFKFNIMDEASIFINGQYRTPITNQANNYHFQYGIGFSSAIGQKK